MFATDDARPNQIGSFGSGRIAELNDRLRCSKTGGRIAITQGVLATGAVEVILAQVRIFDAFDADNDPYGQRDFGALDCGGEKVFWKIDYYDQAMQFGSPDPADPSITCRVLTVMLASEY
jgi:hypothetical protein